MRKTMNFINVTPVFPDDMEITVREICRRARTVGLNKIALCLSFHPQGTPAKENADFLLQLHRNVRAALKAECDGLQIGVLVQSLLGHGWSGSVPLTGETWQNIIMDDGRKSSRICPLDPDFRKYVLYCIGALVRDGAEFLLIDDDFGLKVNECCCPAHLSQYRQASGMNWQTPQELRDYLAARPWNDPAASAVSRLRGKVIIDLAADIRAVIDEYDPDLVCCMCTPWTGRGFVEDVAVKLAGRGKPLVRVDNAVYGCVNPLSLYSIMNKTCSLIRYMPKIRNFIAESDTFPQSIYSESAAVFNAHVILGILCGLSGCKLWMAEFGSSGTPYSQRRYERIFAENCGLYEELFNTVDSIRWKGVNSLPVKWPKLQFLHMQEAQTPCEIKEWNERIFGPFAVPIMFSDYVPDAITAVTAPMLDGLDDRQIRELFKGKLLIDASAAKVLTARGFSPLMGVEARQGDEQFFFSAEKNHLTGEWCSIMANADMAHLTVTDGSAEIVSSFFRMRTRRLLDPVAPAVVHFVNSLNGRVAVFGWCPTAPVRTTLRLIRKEWMIQTLDFLNGSPMEMWVETDFQVLVRHGVLPEGDELFFAMSLAADHDEQIAVRCFRRVKSVSRLMPDGQWRPAVFEQENGTCRIMDPLCLAEANIYRFSFDS